MRRRGVLLAAAAPTSGVREFGKYMAHGLAFSILFLIVGVVWSVIFLLLVVCGFIIGLVIGIVLFFVFMGYVNSIVTEVLWFPVRTGFLTCLGHGLVLFLALLPLNLVLFGVQLVVRPDLLAVLVLFLATSPLVGAIAKFVARIWEAPRVVPPVAVMTAPAEAPPPPYEPPWK